MLRPVGYAISVLYGIVILDGMVIYVACLYNLINGLWYGLKFLLGTYSDVDLVTLRVGIAEKVQINPQEQTT